VPKVVSDTVDAHQALQETAATRPTSTPSTATQHSATHPATEPGDSLGKYLTIGGVLAEVNGQAIYADKVFAAIDKALHAKALEQDEQQFRITAQKLINDEVKTEINEELVYAAAQRALSPEEKNLADAATERWRQQQITEAGGSLELARRKAQAQGDDFDELVRNEAKKMLIRLYYTKKVYPRVQVTADEMRRYYERNRDALFTEHAAAKFRLIKIEPDRTGGRDKALSKIADIRRRALAGEDFAQLARDFNDDPALLRTGGLIGNGWVDKGAFKLEDVENALWKLQPHQLTDIIDSHGAFYLAYLEDLKRGKVIPFESQQVQQQIRETLSAAELRELREQVQDRLMQHAVVSENPNLMDIALEMAMQKYARWTR
jgi:parvulin-like peptidyl-prolyl isomerase